MFNIHIAILLLFDLILFHVIIVCILYLSMLWYMLWYIDIYIHYQTQVFGQLMQFS